MCPGFTSNQIKMDQSKTTTDGVNVSVITPSAYVRFNIYKHYIAILFITYHPPSFFLYIFQPPPNAQYPPYPNTMPTTDAVVTQPQQQPLAEFRSKYNKSHIQNDFIHKNISQSLHNKKTNFKHTQMFRALLLFTIV